MKSKFSILLSVLLLFSFLLVGCSSSKQQYLCYSLKDLNKYVKVTNLGTSEYRLTGEDSCYIIYNEDIILGQLVFNNIDIYNNYIDFANSNPESLKILNPQVTDKFTYLPMLDFTAEGESTMVLCTFPENPDVCVTIFVESRDQAVVNDVLSLIDLDIISESEYLDLEGNK